MEPSWEWGTKNYINGPGHMTKMAAMPIYGKRLLKPVSQEPMKLDMQHQGFKLYRVYINDDAGLTLTYFTAKSNWVAYTLEWGKLLQSY